MNRVLRTWLLGLLAAAVGLLSVERSQPHRVLDEAAPATAFSAARARSTLARLLGPERPHPLGSAADAAVRARILAQFAALGVPAHTYQAFTCNTWRGFGQIPCATVDDIIAEVIPGPGRAIVMMAHYDSVPAGPGASDDGSGVAAVLEAARALRAAGLGANAGAGGLHPVMALITDGEEAGLLGANAFLQNAALRARVGAVVNVEARGTNGPSLLFQTSPGDARLIDLYAAHVPAVASSSLYADIYRYLPNDTDLTLFIRDGFPAFNFAFVGNVRYYHSPLDLRRNLDAASLQMQGDNLLGVVCALSHTPYGALAGGDAIYLSVFNAVLLRLPAAWALPLAIIAFLALALAAWLARPGARVPGAGAVAGRKAALRAALIPPALVAAAVAAGFLLMLIARLSSGMPQPAYAHPVPLRIALALGAWTTTLLLVRAGNVPTAAAGAWLWMAGLGIVAAALLPGISPYFVFPALVAAILLLATSRARGGWEGIWGRMALLLSALSAVVIWIALAAGAETLRGLQLYPLLMIAGALALIGLVPLLAVRPMSAQGRNASAVVSGAAAVAAALVAGLLPPYSAASPQRLDLLYLESPDSGNAASWLAEPVWEGHGTGPLPTGLRQAGRFQRIQALAALLGGGTADSAAAGAARLPLPRAAVRADAVNHGVRDLTVQLHGSPDSDAMMLFIPASAALQTIELRGQHLTVPRGWHGATRLLCLSPDCRDATVTLELAGPLPALQFAEQRYGLPPFGAALRVARPASAMTSQGGDQVILVNALRLQ
jgi:hypothetical protein